MNAMTGAAAAKVVSASDTLHPLADDGWQLLHGDCRALLATMADASVDSVVTDPPYELGFMGAAWDKSGIANDAAMWREVLRVLKPGGYLLAFSHARTYHRMVCAIEDAGFEIRDQIMWIYGSGFPKGGNRNGRGTQLKPAHEPIVVARRPLVGSVAANEARFGTGAMNIDACRVASDDANPSIARPEVFATARPGKQLGRWPANVVLDDSDDVVEMLPVSTSMERRSEKVRQRPRSDTSRVYGQCHSMAPTASYPGGGSAARFFYCAKASRADREDGLSELPVQQIVQFATGNGESGVASSLSAGRDTRRANIHPTVKPTALMCWLVRLVTPEGGLVLDPFTGSGSTGRAAVLEGRRFVGCEITDAYLPIAAARIASALIEMTAAAEAEPDQFPLPLAERQSA